MIKAKSLLSVIVSDKVKISITNGKSEIISVLVKGHYFLDRICIATPKQGPLDNFRVTSLLAFKFNLKNKIG